MKILNKQNFLNECVFEVCTDESEKLFTFHIYAYIRTKAYNLECIFYFYYKLTKKNNS